jgi:hypothetical protein
MIPKSTQLEHHFRVQFSELPGGGGGEVTLLRIREVRGSNLDTQSGYPDQSFLWFSSVLPGKWQDSTLTKTTIDSFHVRPNSSFTHNHPSIQRYITHVIEKASLKNSKSQSNLHLPTVGGSWTKIPAQQINFFLLCKTEICTRWIIVSQRHQLLTHSLTHSMVQDIQFAPSILSKVYLNVIPPPTPKIFPMVSSLRASQPKLRKPLSPPLCVPHVPPISSSLT